jgi:hypothetical protein
MSSFIHPMSQLIHSTVRIECKDSLDQKSSGTGFIFLFCEKNSHSFACIVTNKHVVQGAVSATFHLTLKDENGNPALGSYEPVVLDAVQQYCIPHPSDDIDLVAFHISPILNRATKSGRE